MPAVADPIWYYRDVEGLPQKVMGWIVRVDSATLVQVVVFTPEGTVEGYNADSTQAPGLYGWEPRG